MAASLNLCRSILQSKSNNTGASTVEVFTKAELFSYVVKMIRDI